MEDELEGSRERQEDLKAQIKRLQGRLKASQDWIALTEDHFRDAITSGLELMGAEPLEPSPVTAGASSKTARFVFPALDQRRGADPTWAETMDTLRVPRRRDQKPWEWRQHVSHPTGRL